MSHERSAITAAIESTPNLGEAAKALGASRRTLQNRMRAYDIPKGKAGRPREELPYHRGGSASTGTVVGALAVVAAAVLWWRSRAPVVAGEQFAGCDALGCL